MAVIWRQKLGRPTRLPGIVTRTNYASSRRFAVVCNGPSTGKYFPPSLLKDPLITYDLVLTCIYYAVAKERPC